MRAGGLLALLLVLAPRSAQACATCIASPFGDRTYTWPYIGLILLPFGLLATVFGIFAHSAGYRPRVLARRLAARFSARDDSQIIKETT
jgi:hypothetical protein